MPNRIHSHILWGLLLSVLIHGAGLTFVNVVLPLKKFDIPPEIHFLGQLFTSLNPAADARRDSSGFEQNERLTGPNSAFASSRTVQVNKAPLSQEENHRNLDKPQANRAIQSADSKAALKTSFLEESPPPVEKPSEAVSEEFFKELGVGQTRDYQPLRMHRQ